MFPGSLLSSRIRRPEHRQAQMYIYLLRPILSCLAQHGSNVSEERSRAATYYSRGQSSRQYHNTPGCVHAKLSRTTRAHTHLNGAACKQATHGGLVGSGHGLVQEGHTVLETVLQSLVPDLSHIRLNLALSDLRRPGQQRSRAGSLQDVHHSTVSHSQNSPRYCQLSRLAYSIQLRCTIITEQDLLGRIKTTVMISILQIKFLGFRVQSSGLVP